MTLRFGTDGVRGVANAELTPELVLALGRAASRVLGGGGAGKRPRFLVGRPLPVQAPYSFVRARRTSSRTCRETRSLSRARCRAHSARLPRQ